MPRHIERIRGGPNSGLHLWLVLWKTHSAVRAFASEDIASRGLSLTDFAILETILHTGPLAVNDIGKRVALTSGSMTIAIDRLQERGLVDRRSDETDRRSRLVRLTPAGTKLISGAFAAHAETMNALGDALTKPERQQLILLLKKFGRAAARPPGREPHRAAEE